MSFCEGLVAAKHIHHEAVRTSRQGSFIEGGASGGLSGVMLPPLPGMPNGIEHQGLPARSTYLRFAVLVFGPGFMFGNFYFFDQTSATQKYIIELTGMSTSTFGVLSSVYSWPNVILPLFGGILIDVLGNRIACVSFSIVVLMGSVLFSVGIAGNKVWLMIVGRVIFGMGGESQNVACLAIISKWFRGSELAFAMSISIAVSRLGSVAVFNSQPSLIKSWGITDASWFTTFLCGVSLCSAFFVACIDKAGDTKDKANGHMSGTGADALDEPVNIMAVFSLPKMFWLVAIACLAVYVAAFPFMQVTSTPYLGSFGYSDEVANSITSLPNLVSAFASPIAGLVMDRFGRRPPFIVLSCLMFITCYVGFIVYPPSYQPVGIYSLYILLGAALSLFGSVIWPCVPLVVEENLVGTAIGLTTALQNFGMAVSPMALAAMVDEPTTAPDSMRYTYPFIYIIACISFGALAGVGVWIMDVKGDRKLMKGSATS